MRSLKISHEAISFIDASRPDVTAEMLQMFWLPDPSGRITKGRFHQVERAERHLAVGVHPEAHILQALVLDHGVPRAFRGHVQGATPSCLRNVARSVAFFRPRRARVSAASKRTAFSAERRSCAVSRRLDSSSAGMSAMSSWPRR